LLREGMTRAPGDVAVRVELARLLVAAGRPDEALPLTEDTVARASADPRAWQARRETLVARGRWTEALAAAEKERALGAPPPFQARVTLALGAEDPARLGELARRPGEVEDQGDAEIAAALRAFVAGTAGEGDRITLGRLAPGEHARRFVARPALAPPPVGDLAGLLGWTHALVIATPALVGLAPAAARAVEAFDRPLLVAVMGEFNAGKSSFVNALCGADVAPTGVTPTTATINVLRFGERAETRVVRHDGSTEQVRAADAPTFLSGLRDQDARAIRSVDIFLPVEALRRVEIVDTPGLNAIRPEHERVAREFLRDADAIVWVFAAGQAAKATEREALAVAHAAGKRVVGVVNKIDLAGPGELKAVLRHVEKTLGDLVDSVVPFSATAAAEARRAGRPDPGLEALTDTLDRRFLADARALKRQTALGALHRLVDAARAAAPAPRLPDAEHRRAAEARIQRDLASTLDAERIALGARIEAGYRRAAIEVRDFVQPRTWLFGENRATPADEDFLAELLEDAVSSALDATRAALHGAVADAAADPETAALAARASHTVDAALELFAAYARGTIRAGVVPDFFRHQLPRLRLELPAIREALARRAPSPEAPLFAGLRRELELLFRQAAEAREARAADEAMRAIIHEEGVERPLAALADAIAALEAG
ncbi:MAG: dynamin family protein, partial [Pseudomonadota bacterium]